MSKYTNYSNVKFGLACSVFLLDHNCLKSALIFMLISRLENGQNQVFFSRTIKLWQQSFTLLFIKDVFCISRIIEVRNILAGPELSHLWSYQIVVSYFFIKIGEISAIQDTMYNICLIFCKIVFP